MKTRKSILSYGLGVAVLVLCGATSCSDESPTGAGDKLCAQGAGVGLRITGKAEPLDVCVPDDEVVGNIEQGVQTLFTVQNRYDVTATLEIDGTVYEIKFLFRHNPDFPRALNLTGNLAQATNDPDGVWLYYHESPLGGDAVESVGVTGSFRMTFSDGSIAVGTMSGVKIDLVDVNTGDPAGSRSIPEGFLSISTDP